MQMLELYADLVPPESHVLLVALFPLHAFCVQLVSTLLLVLRVLLVRLERSTMHQDSPTASLSRLLNL